MYLTSILVYNKVILYCELKCALLSFFDEHHNKLNTRTGSNEGINTYSVYTDILFGKVGLKKQLLKLMWTYKNQIKLMTSIGNK